MPITDAVASQSSTDARTTHAATGGRGSNGAAASAAITGGALTAITALEMKMPYRVCTAPVRSSAWGITQSSHHGETRPARGASRAATSAATQGTTTAASVSRLN